MKVAGGHRARGRTRGLAPTLPPPFRVIVDRAIDSSAQSRAWRCWSGDVNGVNPHAWLRATLEAITAGHPNSRLDEFLS